MDMSAFAIPQKCTIPKGAYGVWQIPELGIVVPLYYMNGSAGQKYVDKENSALITKYGVGFVIADHAGSKDGHGIWQMEDVSLNDAAFLVRPGATYRYKCIELLTVDVLSNCYKIEGQVVYPRAQNNILCVSCTDKTGKKNYMAVFKRIGKVSK